MIRASVVNRRSLRRSLVRIVVAFDQHLEQIAFDALDTATGEVRQGRIRPADRLGFRRWLGRWRGREIEAALEATTRLAVHGRGAPGDRRRDALGGAG
jgi:hypothetical protein